MMVGRQMTLEPSATLQSLLLLSHGAAGGAVFLAGLGPLPAIALWLLIVASLAYHSARDAWLRLPGSWHAILVGPEGASFMDRSGTHPGRVARQTFASPYFIVLGIQPEQGGRAVFRTLFPDAMSEQDFRELSVYLRYA